jgi:hypothetical protein
VAEKENCRFSRQKFSVFEANKPDSDYFSETKNALNSYSRNTSLPTPDNNSEGGKFCTVAPNICGSSA